MYLLTYLIFTLFAVLLVSICAWKISSIRNENNNLKQEQRIKDIINVLSSECNAIYYCNYDTDKYDIVFQQGYVREELLQMLELMPRYQDAFNGYVEMLVYPDDRPLMHTALSSFGERLKNRKSFREEFRRKYGETYLYTEMNCVKIGEAEDELHEFVVSFVENDAAYRSVADSQRQLEFTVNERSVELQEKNDALKRINEVIIELLGNLTEARDTNSGEHIRRVKGFTHILAEKVMNEWPEYGITPDAVELMTSASALHDIGKIMIPDAILLKPGKLTPEEFEIMKTHSEKGCEILRKAPDNWSESYVRIGMDICRYHHEKWDGRGYPDGLKGDEIPIAAQIVSIADCFDALTSKRPYKQAYDAITAYNMILNGECGEFSPKLLTSFKECRSELFRHSADKSSTFESIMPAGISTASLSWTKILFVDDNEMSRDIGVDILLSEGAEVIPAESGQEAIRIFSESEPGYFDAILMDVIMPEMDGMQTTKLIRALDRPDAGNISIIALTSLETEDAVNRCIEAGMDAFLTKPISITKLDKVLYECMKSHTAALESTIKRSNRNITEDVKRELGSFEDYDFICHVNGNNNDVSFVYGKPIFEDALKSMPANYPSNRKFDRLLREFVPKESFQKFLKDTNRYLVLDNLRTQSYYQISVPIEINDAEYMYKLIVVPDNSMSNSFIIALTNVEAVLTETRKQLEKAEIRAVTDGLTGLYNVTAYTDSMTELTERIKAGEKLEFAMVICDVDNLKGINDSFEHDAGDRYLLNSTVLMREVFQNSDIFRIGGDEFAVIVTGKDYSNRDELMKKLHNKIEMHKTRKSVEEGLTSMSAGISDYMPGSDKSSSEVMKRADGMLYEKKKQKK